MDTLVLEITDFRLEIFEETIFISERRHQGTYKTELRIGAKAGQDPTYGVRLLSGNQEISSCLVVSTGGALGLNERSVVAQGGSIFIAIGNRVCCLQVPSLGLLWSREVDLSSCRSLYLLPETDSVIAQGELEISRINPHGEIIWHICGKDIFVGELSVDARVIGARDFEGNQYRISTDDGSVRLQDFGRSGGR